MGVGSMREETPWDSSSPRSLAEMCRMRAWMKVSHPLRERTSPRSSFAIQSGGFCWRPELTQQKFY